MMNEGLMTKKFDDNMRETKRADHLADTEKYANK
jgi:hypothetical protein